MSTPDLLSALQIRLAYAFRDRGLLLQATTHRSFGADHNERLEFLGDSVLNLAVAHLLFTQLSQLPEGDLRGSAPTWSSKTPCRRWRCRSACPR